MQPSLSRPLVAIACLVSLQGACVYQRFSLSEAPKSSAPGAPGAVEDRETHAGTEEMGEDVPTSVEEEHKRRRRRRRWAMALGPAEMLAGAGIVALAVHSLGTPIDDGSPPEMGSGSGGAIKESAKSVLGSLLLASAGGALFASGLGDFTLGLSDHAFASPFIRRGADGAPSLQIDPLAPPLPTWQLDAHLGTQLSLRAAETELGLGMFRWLSPTWRLRVSAAVDLGRSFGERSDYLAATPGLQFDWNPGARTHFGRELGHALSLQLSPRVRFSIDHTSPVLGYRVGIGYSSKNLSMLIGASQFAEERLPAIELNMIYRMTTD